MIHNQGNKLICPTKLGMWPVFKKCNLIPAFFKKKVREEVEGT
jgi:hypothetical protein